MRDRLLSAVYAVLAIGVCVTAHFMNRHNNWAMDIAAAVAIMMLAGIAFVSVRGIIKARAKR